MVEVLGIIGAFVCISAFGYFANEAKREDRKTWSKEVHSNEHQD